MHDRVKQKLGLVTSTQDIGNRSEVIIVGADRSSGWLAKNFRRTSMNNLLEENSSTTCLYMSVCRYVGKDYHEICLSIQLREP